LIDGSAGLLGDGDMLPTGDRAWWQRHRERVEQAARRAGGQPPEENALRGMHSP
jgi:hypothetical protein